MLKQIFALSLLSAISTGVSAQAAQPGRPLPSAEARYNCADVFKEKNVKVCTDLGPISQCRGDKSRIVKKGEAWADEFQLQDAEQTWVTDKEICVTNFTDVATIAGCCGG